MPQSAPSASSKAKKRNRFLFLKVDSQRIKCSPTGSQNQGLAERGLDAAVKRLPSSFLSPELRDEEGEDESPESWA